ncbi:MAG: hypothetical protein FJ125_04825 [Deltaproteobacteria bacterium]|nr:hypothetical protein [Deltaproteobacteria bacterium]
MKNELEIIPSCWSGEEALLVAALLERLLAAVRTRYLIPMLKTGYRHDWIAAARPPNPCDTCPSNEDIPF